MWPQKSKQFAAKNSGKGKNTNNKVKIRKLTATAKIDSEACLSWGKKKQLTEK